MMKFLRVLETSDKVLRYHFSSCLSRLVSRPVHLRKKCEMIYEAQDILISFHTWLQMQVVNEYQLKWCTSGDGSHLSQHILLLWQGMTVRYGLTLQFKKVDT